MNMELHFEDTNAIFNIMANLAARINDDRYKINRKNKPKEQLLFGLQMKYMELDESINQILSGKKGAEEFNGALYTKGTEKQLLELLES